MILLPAFVLCEIVIYLWLRHTVSKLAARLGLWVLPALLLLVFRPDGFFLILIVGGLLAICVRPKPDFWQHAAAFRARLLPPAPGPRSSTAHREVPDPHSSNPF